MSRSKYELIDTDVRKRGANNVTTATVAVEDESTEGGIEIDTSADEENSNRKLVKPEQQQVEKEEEEEGDEEDEAYESYAPPIRRRTKGRLPIKAALTAIFLFIIGVVFGTLGLVFTFTRGFHESIAFLVIGFIGFVPGSYHVVILILAYMNTPGFTYDMIPSFEGD